MATLQFRIETSEPIGVRYAARVLVSLATIEEGFRIAEEGASGWVEAPLNFRMANGGEVLKYVSELGQQFLSGKATVNAANSRDDPAVAFAIGVFDRFARLNGNGRENAPYLIRLNKGSLEGEIERFFTWLFNVGAAEPIGSPAYDEKFRRVLASGKGSPAIGAGLFVVGSMELHTTLQLLKATDFQATNVRTP